MLIQLVQMSVCFRLGLVRTVDNAYDMIVDIYLGILHATGLQLLDVLLGVAEFDLTGQDDALNWSRGDIGSSNGILCFHSNIGIV